MKDESDVDVLAKLMMYIFVPAASFTMLVLGVYLILQMFGVVPPLE